MHRLRLFSSLARGLSLSLPPPFLIVPLASSISTNRGAVALTSGRLPEQDAHLQQAKQLADAEKRAEKCNKALEAVRGQQLLIRQLEASLAAEKKALASAVAKAKAAGLRADDALATAQSLQTQVVFHALPPLQGWNSAKSIQKPPDKSHKA
jgi:hypothetical protein